MKRIIADIFILVFLLAIGDSRQSATVVMGRGVLSAEGTYVHRTDVPGFSGVRPALCLVL
jgi:hypothetical protein